MFRFVIGYIWCMLTIKLTVAGPVLPPTHYKHRVVEQVCQRISAAWGNPLVRPRLELWRKAGRVARLDVEPGSVPVLRFDERLYDQCRGFGADSLSALACLLSHELAHFYQQQGLVPAYGASTGFVGLSATDRPRLEAEADRFGLYYGYLAGYDTYQLLPRVLKMVYARYQLTHDQKGYPSLAERLATAEQERQRFRPLALAMEAGQLLWLIQHDDDAATCFQYLLTQFRSKEVYNNLGVIRLGQVLRSLPVREAPFAYPCEWDAANRFRLGTLRSEPPDAQRQAAYLQQAKAYFKAALQLDPAYTTAAVNLACAHTLLGNQEAAIGTVQELADLCRAQHTRLPANAWLMSAIAYACNGQPDRASPRFARAVRQGAFQATYNQTVFQKTQSQNQLAGLLPDWSIIGRWIRDVWTRPAAQPQPVLRDEGIGSLRFGHWLAGPGHRDTLLLPDPARPVNLVRQEAPGTTAARLLTTDQRIELLTAMPAYRGQTRAGLRVGHSVGELQKRYGPPDAVLPATGNREFWHYKAVALIVEVQQARPGDRRVRGWHLYRYG